MRGVGGPPTPVGGNCFAPGALHARVADELGGETKTLADEITGAEPGGTPDVPVVTLVMHPAESLIGRRYPLAAGEQLALGRTSVVFGRGTLDLHRISRAHAEIECRDSSVWLQDLGSRNGTFVNGQRLEQARPLESGDVVGIGPVLLLFGRGPVVSRSVGGGSLVGVSAALAGVQAAIDRVAADEVVVLVHGETGVGKELVAHELHRRSGRAGELVALNCAAVADGVLHSELFGHSRGAFSGADSARPGLLARAAGGTLLLDEIGDASAPFQGSLLRLLEQRSYRPVGSDEVRHSDARIVAATHCGLADEVEQGHFRADLYARLERCVIEVPPLRARPTDIIPLALYFARRLGGGPVLIARSLAVALLRHHWPRNVRELSTVIEQAVRERSVGESLRLSVALRKRLVRSRDDGRGGVEALSTRAPSARPARPSAAELRTALAQLGGNVSAAAERLGVTRRTVYRWANELGVDLQAIRRGER